MGEKPEVLDAVLKETVDLVMDVRMIFLFVVGTFYFLLLDSFFCFVLFLFRLLCLQENIPIEEVFENLRCTKEGLTATAAQERLSIFGYNKLEEKKVS